MSSHSSYKVGDIITINSTPTTIETVVLSGDFNHYYVVRYGDGRVDIYREKDIERIAD